MLTPTQLHTRYEARSRAFRRLYGTGLRPWESLDVDMRLAYIRTLSKPTPPITDADHSFERP